VVVAAGCEAAVDGDVVVFGGVGVLLLPQKDHGEEEVGLEAEVDAADADADGLLGSGLGSVVLGDELGVLNSAWSWAMNLEISGSP
jgi:hypothetical protein